MGAGSWDWVDGSLMIGLPELPPLDTLMAATEGEMEAAAGIERPYAIAAIGIADRAAFDAEWPAIWDGIGEADASEEYAGTTIWTTEDEGETTVAAVAGDLLLLGMDRDRVAAAIDRVAAGGPSLATSAAYADAVAGLPADRVGTLYINTGRLRDELGAQVTEMLAQGLEVGDQAAQLQDQLAALPASVVGAIRLDPDHITAALSGSIAESPMTAPVGTSDLATRMPADTILYLESRDLGTILKEGLAQARPLLAADEETEASLQQIEALLGANLEDLLSWAGDLALGVTVGEAGPSFGLVADVTDEAAADERINGLLALIRMFAAGGEDSPITVDQEVVGEITVTTLALTDASGMTEGLPVEASISVALGGGHFYLGLGDFARGALEQDPATSLAASPAFAQAIDPLGENGGFLWTDLASAIGLAALTMDPAEAADFEAQAGILADVLGPLVAYLDAEDGVGTAAIQIYLR